MDEFRSWEFLIQEQVKSGDMIRLPEVVKETVGVDHMLQGPSIFWSIENENRFIVLSESSLEKDAYTNVGIYEIYDIDTLDEEGARIRPPNDIGEVWAADPKPGERVFYLTHERMRRGQKPSVYLLSESQVLIVIIAIVFGTTSRISVFQELWPTFWSSTVVKSRNNHYQSSSERSDWPTAGYYGLTLRSAWLRWF